MSENKLAKAVAELYTNFDEAALDISSVFIAAMSMQMDAEGKDEIIVTAQDKGHKYMVSVERFKMEAE